MNEWTEKIERLELALEVRKHEQPLIAVLDKRIDLLEAENKRLLAELDKHTEYELEQQLKERDALLDECEGLYKDIESINKLWLPRTTDIKHEDEAIALHEMRRKILFALTKIKNRNKP